MGIFHSRCLFFIQIHYFAAQTLHTMRSILTALFFISLIATSCGKEESLELGDPVDNTGGGGNTGGGNNTGGGSNTGGGGNTGGGTVTIPGGYHLSYTENGQRKELKGFVQGLKNNIDGSYMYTIMASQSLAGFPQAQIMFSGEQGAPALAPSTFKSGAATNKYSMSFSIATSISQQYSSAFSPEGEFELTIAAISTGEMSGTFKGKLVDLDDNEITVSNGTFRVKLQ
ncbi:MAG: hypothetical protein ACO1NW_18135 [Chitinophagaceae bacterium]